MVSGVVGALPRSLAVHRWVHACGCKSQGEEGMRGRVKKRGAKGRDSVCI